MVNLQFAFRKICLMQIYVDWKLEYYGVRKEAYNWFASYLSDRTQCTKVNDSFSNILPTTCGFARGNTLAHLLCFIYMNDCIKASSILNFILHADNTSVFSSSNEKNTLCLRWMLKQLIYVNGLKSNTYRWVQMNLLQYFIGWCQYLMAFLL